MAITRFATLSALALSLALGLSGCEDAGERAARHYQSALALIEAGDTDRALIELRNALKYDTGHKEARAAYARLQRERGELGDAYGQYLQLAEQYPDTAEARLALAEMATEAEDWTEALRHGRAARDLIPDNPAVILVNAVLDYREAVLARDPAAAEAPAALVRDLLDKDPGSVIALRVAIDHAVATGDPQAALPLVEAALQARPDNREFHGQRLRLLAARKDDAAVGAALKEAVARFPADAEFRNALILWHLQAGDLDGAETFLRSLAEAPGAGPGEWLAVVDFLGRARGRDAARAELDRLIASQPDPALYRARRAAMTFEEGDTQAAIAEMEAVLADSPPSDETDGLRVLLARMMLAGGDEAGARAQVDMVLEHDPEQVAALKLRASWLIAQDKPDEAIAILRSVLARAPRDPEVLVLMGEAHEREGARDLAGERYALAVAASGRAAAESLRYAHFLMADGRLDSAESVLDEALAADPGNPEVLDAMAALQLRKGDWAKVARIVGQLRAIGSDTAIGMANDLHAELLLRQDRTAETDAFLDSLMRAGQSTDATLALLVQARVHAGKLDEARALLDGALAQTPRDPALRLLRAGLFLLEDDPAGAEALYRGLIDDFPAEKAPVEALTAILLHQDRAEEADAVIEAAAAANPGTAWPLLMKARRLEETGDYEGAIAIHDELYAADSGNLVVANNLASLLSSHREDAESLERAFIIARRLHGLGIPAFEDTYGWIEYRRGNPAKALRHLEIAARDLPDEPMVQLHLGMAYHALNRDEEARAALTRALDLAGNNPPPQLARASEILAELDKIP